MKKIINKDNLKGVLIGLMVTCIGMLSLLSIIGSVLITKLPKELIPYKNVTNQYYKEILWSKNKLNEIGLVCPKEWKINVYQELIGFTNERISGLVTSNQEINIVLSKNTNLNNLKVKMIQSLGFNCLNKTIKGNSYLSESSISIRDNDTIQNIKKYGIVKNCYKKSCVFTVRKHDNDYGNELINKISNDIAVISYKDIKIDLDNYIDSKDTIAELEKNPKQFLYNFKNNHNYPLMFNYLSNR